jgi:hypothetical protein
METPKPCFLIYNGLITPDELKDLLAPTEVESYENGLATFTASFKEEQRILEAVRHFEKTVIRERDEELRKKRGDESLARFEEWCRAKRLD